MRQTTMAKLPDTAILLFSRTAQEEARAKTFSHSTNQKGNIAIAHRLIRHCESVARQTKLPFFPFFSKNQKGTSFGERLAHAMEEVFDKGFQKVIVIGNDCPALSAKTLSKVFHQLKNEKLILGPAADGGVYLIGMDKAVFQREKFIVLPWEKSSIQSAFEKYTETNKWLRQLSDIDNAAEFSSFLNSLPKYHSLKKELGHILLSFSPNFSIYKKYILSPIYLPNLSLRAPPF